MRVRVALAMACVGAMATSVPACSGSGGRSPNPGRSPGDTDASVVLDSDCATLTVTDHTRGHQGKNVTWEVRSNCKAPNAGNDEVVIAFDNRDGQPIACPCKQNLTGGKLDLAELVDPNAKMGVAFKYKVTLHGVSVDPDLEIDP